MKISFVARGKKMKEISDFHSQTVQIKVACKMKVCYAIISYKW
jgi:hypothetical protein